MRDAVFDVDPWLTISMHSFTPNYEGSIREVEIGILFEEYDTDLAELA